MSLKTAGVLRTGAEGDGLGLYLEAFKAGVGAALGADLRFSGKETREAAAGFLA